MSSDFVEKTVSFIVTSRQRNASKTGWNFRKGCKRITVKELPRANTAADPHRFIVKEYGADDRWVGALGIHKLAPIALKIAFETVLDERSTFA
jgi:hypothetical protein